MTDKKNGLPSGWIEARLRHIVEVLDSRRIPLNATERAKRPGPYPYYGANGQAGVIDDYLFDGDYALLAEDGGYFDDRSRGVAYRATGKFWVNNHAHIIGPLGGMTSSFLVHAFNNLDWMPFVSGTTRLKLTQAKMAEVPLRLPPLNEQRRIVAKIEALQSRSGAAKQALDAIPPLLEKLRQSVLAAAFRGDLTKAWREAHPDVEPASKLLERIRAERRRRWEEANPRKKYLEPEGVDAEKLPELPDGWCWAWLSDCGDVARGKSKHRPRNDARLFGDKYPFIQTGEVARSAGRITSADTFYSDFGLAQSRLFPVGTVCITIAANIADSAILDIPACFPDSVVGVIPDTGLLSSEIIEFFIRTVRDDLEAFAPATAQKNINLAVLSQVAVPVPPVAERLEIERILGQSFALVTSLSKAHTDVVTLRSALTQSILAKAFRGELVPQDPSDEPASVLLERIRAEREATPTRPRATKRPRARKTTAKAR